MAHKMVEDASSVSNCTDSSCSDVFTTSAAALVMFTSDVNRTSSMTNKDTQMDNIRMICEVWLCIPIALAGIVGNILSLIVLCHHKQVLTTTVVLKALAVADTLVLVLTIVLRSLRYVGIPGYDADFLSFIFPYLFAMMNVVRLVDTWLTVLLTVDRYIAVCHPLHAQHLCTIRRTYVMIVVMIVAVTLFCIPRHFEYERVDVKVSPTRFHRTALLENRTYAIGYGLLAFFVVMYLIPMTMLTVLNTWILLALRRSTAQRNSALGIHQGKSSNLKKNAGASSAARTVTLIAVTIVLICIACNITAMTAHIFYALHVAFGNTFSHLGPYQRHLANYSNVLVTLNSAVNFVVYCAFSRKFRNVLVRICGIRRSRLNCYSCCKAGHKASACLEEDTCSDSMRRSSNSSKYSSHVTKQMSMTSIRSTIKRGVGFPDEKESQSLCDSSVL